MTVAPLNPPQRLLCGPGPANISPAVQDAMQHPLLGHMDPDLADINAEVVDLLRAAYQAPDAVVVLPLDAHPDARLMTVVHAETSSGALHPLKVSALWCAIATCC